MTFYHHFMIIHPYITSCVFIFISWFCIYALFEFYKLTLKHISIWFRGYPPEWIMKDKDFKG
jgi:hypothetical protein